SAIAQTSCVGIVQGSVWWNSSGFLATTSAPAMHKPIVAIINTSFDADHTGGNAAIAAIGRSHIGVAAQEAWIMSHESAPPRQGLPPKALPTETNAGPYKKMNFVKVEGVVMWNHQQAPRAGERVRQIHD